MKNTYFLALILGVITATITLAAEKYVENMEFQQNKLQESLQMLHTVMDSETCGGGADLRIVTPQCMADIIQAVMRINSYAELMERLSRYS